MSEDSKPSKANTFGMTNMKVAIGFRWKARNDGGDNLTISTTAILVGATRQVVVDDLAQKVRGLGKSAGRRFR